MRFADRCRLVHGNMKLWYLFVRKSNQNHQQSSACPAQSDTHVWCRSADAYRIMDFERWAAYGESKFTATAQEAARSCIPTPAASTRYEDIPTRREITTHIQTLSKGTAPGNRCQDSWLSRVKIPHHLSFSFFTRHGNSN